MSFKNVTLPQALIFTALLAAVIVTYKMFGEGAGAVMLGIQGIFTFFMGRGDPPPPNDGQGGGPNLKVINGGGNSLTRALFGSMLAITLMGCGAALPAVDDPELAAVAKKLANCRTEARAYVQTSGDPQSRETALAAYNVYEKCKEREGVK